MYTGSMWKNQESRSNHDLALSVRLHPLTGKMSQHLLAQCHTPVKVYSGY